MEEVLNRPLQTDYLHQLTDDTGIFQHTKFGIPDRGKGYTTDDNSRALIAAVMLYRDQRDSRSLNLISTYLAFVHHAQNEDGNFRNFMNYQRMFVEESGSEDCFGRCLWALGYTLSEPSVPDNLQNTCRYMINEALPNVLNLDSPRAIAYAIVGLSYLLETPDALTYKFPYPYVEEGISVTRFLPRETIVNFVEKLARRLQMQYNRNKEDTWQWFENSITYGNAMLPWALLKASRICSIAGLQNVAKESLDFLVSITFSNAGYFKPVGNHGWLQMNGKAALYDEQPIEACEMLLACREAFEIYEDRTYLILATQCFEWFHGRNSLHESLIDPQSGGCYDGIHSLGLNLNQGSENVVSYCIAHLVMNNE